MNLKKWAWMAGLLIATLASTAVPGYSDTWSFQDDDIEAILRCTGTTPGTGCTNLTSGTLSVGDVFFAVYEIPTFTINGVTSGIPAGQELTGVVAIEVTAISGVNYTFGAWDGLNQFLDLQGYTGTNLADGAMIAMYLNGTSGAGGDRNLNLDAAALNGATNCTSVADCTFQATLGNLFQVDGFTGAGGLAGLDEFWTASLVDPDAGGPLLPTADIAAILNLSRTLNVAVFNFATTNLFQDGAVIGFINPFTGLECPTDASPCVRGLVGTGNVSGGQGLTNGFIAHSDFDAQKVAAPIPEPSTVSLLGLGLLALGALRMRSKKA